MSTSNAAESKSRAKGMWQRVASIKKRPIPRLTRTRSKLSRADSEELRQSLEPSSGNDDTFQEPAQHTVMDINEHERTKAELEELKMQQTTTQAQLPPLRAQLERANKSLEIVRAENARKAANIETLQKEIRRLKDRLNILEYKCMDAEKMEITVENLKKANELIQQKLLEKEHEARRGERLVVEQEIIIHKHEEKAQDLTLLIDDLKLQVKEEIMRNGTLEDKVKRIPRLEETIQERDNTVEQLKKDLEEKSCLALHARNVLREEKDKNKKLVETKMERARQNEEYQMTLSETTTLKQLLLAKDTLLVKKSQIIANIEAILRENPDSELRRKLGQALRNEGNTSATYPFGCRVDATKRIIQEIEGTNDNEDISLPGATAPVSATGDEVISCGLSSSRTNTSEATKGTTTSFLQSLLDQHSDTEVKRCTTTSSIARAQHTNVRPKTCIVRPQAYNSTFADFRSLTSVDDQVADLRSEPNTPHDDENSGKVRRSRSVKVSKISPRGGAKANRVLPRGVDTPEADMLLSSCSSTGSGKCFVRTISFTSPALIAPARDRKMADVVHIGDRVKVQLGNRKDKAKGQHIGTVHYIGTLDKKHNSSQLYVGVKFDEQVGNTDGTYNSTRHFTCCGKRGGFVRICKIVSVLDATTGSFRNIREVLSGQDDTTATRTTPSQQNTCLSD